IETMTPTGVLRVMNTHLDASREETYRLQEIEHLLDAIRARSPLLVGGDFNAEPGSGVHDRLRAAGLRDAALECGEGNGLTFPASQPVKRIDYLFFVGDARCTSARVLDSRASDHRVLLVIVRHE
ncbi:MAG TPA: endonuclease/exonuclease/phosphatase family protein, partial [Thermoanaerobaculia bacterium]